MDGERDGKKKSLRQSYRTLFLPRSAKADWTGGQPLTQLQDKLSKDTTPALTADPVALGQAVDFFSPDPPSFLCL